jgi:4-hydroxybenzoate polyprenyltransferase
MTTDNSTTPDALPDHWIERMPASVQPYLRLMRFDRPIGIWLLLLPCWWGSALATNAAQKVLPNFWHLFLFALGAIAMRSAGCIWNDYLDRDIDRLVTRTRVRPLAAGLLSPREGLLLMAALMLAGLVILQIFNGFTVFLGIVSIGIVAIYPYVKRVSDFPQLVLGLAFAWGALLGWSAYFDGLGLPPILLYAAAICWTVGYDTIYAMQDIDDDALIGIGSTPRHFGDKSKIFTGTCYVLTVLLLASAFKLAQTGIAAYLGILAFACFLGWQVYDLHEKKPESALKAFRSNKYAGLVIFVALLLDSLLRFGFHIGSISPAQ